MIKHGLLNGRASYYSEVIDEVIEAVAAFVINLGEQAGIIRYSRGKFTILDRERLQEVSCDCYRIVKEQYKRLGIF